MIILRQKEFNAKRKNKFKGTITPGATEMGRVGDVVLIDSSDPRHEKVKRRIKNGENRDDVLEDEYGQGTSEDQTLIAESYKKSKRI